MKTELIPYLNMELLHSAIVFDSEKWLVSFEGSLTEMVVDVKRIWLTASTCLKNSIRALSSKFDLHTLL